MIGVFLLASALLLDSNSYTVSAKVDGSTCRATMTKAKFRARGRSIFWAKKDEMVLPAMGSKAKPIYFYGHDLGVQMVEGMTLAKYLEKHYTVFTFLKVSWKGKTRVFDKALYQDVLNPTFEQDFVSIKPGAAGSALLRIEGGDGMVGYAITYTIPAKGAITRKIEATD